MSQRGYALKDVIRVGGSTLAETYSRLTGEPQSAAYNIFNALLQQHIGNTTTNNMLLDNIFPLHDPDHRTVGIAVGDPIDKGDSTDAAPVQFSVKPGLLCPAASYGFFRQREQLEQPVYARARGMANASFRWTIESVEVDVRNSFTNVTINTPVTVGNPDGTTVTVAPAVTIQYGILDTWNGSVLYLKTLTTNGNCSLNVSAAAKEADVTDAEVSATAEVDLTTTSWTAGDDFKNAQHRCNPSFTMINNSIWALSKLLSDLKNRPDPPSDPSIRQIADAVHALDAAVSQYAQSGYMTTAEVWEQIGTPGGLRSPYAPAAAPDLTRLRLNESQDGQEDGKRQT